MNISLQELSFLKAKLKDAQEKLQVAETKIKVCYDVLMLLLGLPPCCGGGQVLHASMTLRAVPAGLTMVGRSKGRGQTKC